MKDTFIFAMVGSTYNKARELYSKDEKKYEALYDEIGKIYRKMDTVKTAVDKRIETNFLRAYLCLYVDELGFEQGDEVKVIIIKEE